ncbi:MAG: signal peptidase I [Oscillospiraceae bacterium]|nr:signal peptidase I [Oscillospiraceae bacterium]
MSGGPPVDDLGDALDLAIAQLTPREREELLFMLWVASPSDATPYDATPYDAPPYDAPPAMPAMAPATATATATAEGSATATAPAATATVTGAEPATAPVETPAAPTATATAPAATTPVETPAPVEDPAPTPDLAITVAGPKARSSLFEWVRALVSAIVVVGVFSLFFVRFIGVTGSSMNPTLEQGQRLLISNLFYRPRPGDIIIFVEKNYFEVDGMAVPLVKRVIASAGQEVDIDFTTGEIWVDDVLKDEPYIAETTSQRGDQEFPLTVPPGTLFVMGDNRNDSLDSRFSEIGFIDERLVLGHVLFRVWPINHIGPVGSLWE